ncbi:DUF4132 domain-containing protein [Glycomyces tritici]|uniref:DUF4132 domain-containing protein n=1 Tax=Glycomyces tritici TaxID=2665176 RepID=A0ABT7YNX5_9ACTN|nr:DUF4132 domain-containing protein [Glycomyces tritici]MDN3240300.1 DUF4132 domain-containing protein [Glycomyces tritici]
MTETDPSIPAPLDEDRVDFPDEWHEFTLDWRGRGTPRPVTVDPDAAQRVKAIFAENAERLEHLIDALDVPAYAPTIRAGIAGEADPLGAALALAMLAQVAPGSHRDIEHLGRDAWIGTHGLAFACRAVVELLGYEVYYWNRSGGVYGRVSIQEPNAHRISLINQHLHRIPQLRSLLAALPDDEYAAVCDEVAAHRTSDAKKFGAAMLMPDREDWVREALDLHSGSRRRRYGGHDLVWAIASTLEHAELAGATSLGVYGDVPERIALVLDALGADALPLLVNTIEGEDRPSVEVRELLYDAIGRLPSTAALTYLLTDLTNPHAVAAAKQAAARFPVRALRTVLAIAPSAHAATKIRLAGFARANGLLDAAAALGDAERDRLAELVSRRHPVAETVPDVFTTPPWTPYAKPASKRAALALTPPDVDELRWAPGQQEEWRKISGYAAQYWADPARWDRRDAADPDNWAFNHLIAYAPDERTQPLLPKWDGTSASLTIETLRPILARYGDEVKAHIMAQLKRKTSFREGLAPFVSLDAARLAAGWLSRSRNERAAARSWFDAYPGDAAAFLIPDAVGKDAKLRKAAMDALRYLDRSVVDERAATYGEEAAAAVAALLDADPFDPQLPRIPKPGKWADPGALPQVLLADRAEALPDAAVRTLMTALAMDESERPYPGVDSLAAECDPESLAAFSWGLFELWLSAGSPSKDAWAMDQLQRFADDYAVRHLTERIREWPGQSQNRKAVRGLEVLGGVGSESALRAVHGIAQKAKFKALKKTATEQIQVIAERLELTLDQLGDRLVPDFGLGDDSLVLDYGPRSFTIKFDEALKPYVLDDQGKRKASAPKPNAKDDPELAQPAYERFAALRRDLKATAAEQVKRLEAAMGSRTWSRAEFQEFLVDHPLMWHLSSRLVWQAGDTAFRLAEDRTLADVEDEPFELPDDAVVRLAHPLTLGDEVEAWASVFADYEILQPFDQLARPVFELAEEDRASGHVARFEGATTGGGPLIGLLNRGWKFGGPAARGGGYGLFREFAAGGYVFLDSTPGVHPGYGFDNSTEQTLTNVELVLPEGDAVSPVAISEILLVIARLSRSA